MQGMNMVMKDPEYRGNTVRRCSNWLQRQKKATYQGQLGEVNRQLEGPVMPVRTKGGNTKETKRLI